MGNNFGRQTRDWWQLPSMEKLIKKRVIGRKVNARIKSENK